MNTNTIFNTRFRMMRKSFTIWNLLKIRVHVYTICRAFFHDFTVLYYLIILLTTNDVLFFYRRVHFVL